MRDSLHRAVGTSILLQKTLMAVAQGPCSFSPSVYVNKYLLGWEGLAIATSARSPSPLDLRANVQVWQLASNLFYESACAHDTAKHCTHSYVHD